MSEIENGLSKNKANYAALSPLSFLERTRKTFPNQTAIEYKDYTLTYQQVGERCDALAVTASQKDNLLLDVGYQDIITENKSLF